jgi:Spy/CpxP family protein refolding chaperone
MSDLNTTEPTNPAPATAPKSFWKRGRNLLLVSALVIGAGITGAVVTGGVNAQGGPGFGMGSGMGHGGPGMGFGSGRGFMGGRQLDPAEMEKRADRMIRHVAVEIDATNEQQDKLRTIARGAVKDLLPMRTKMKDAREKAQTLLTQPNLSRSDIESFRTEQMALADTFSKRIAQALGDASEVLNAEQRKKLNELIEHRRESRRWWHRG